MQTLSMNGIGLQPVLGDYDLILVPQWVLNEIGDAHGRLEFLQEQIDYGYPIYSISEENYSGLTGYEEGNLYQIVLASTALIGRVRSYLRRFVETRDPLNMNAYSEWISKLYEEWPIPGEELSNGRTRKKNAGEVSITVLSEVISWYYPETESLTVYTQDYDAYEYQKRAEDILRSVFELRTPVPVAYKSNDSIICQLLREGIIVPADVHNLRKNNRKVTFSREQVDYSVVLTTELADNEFLIELAGDRSVHIVF
ncbi:hypothetical protein SAMN02910368_00201 [Lachnospiraceae bacterium G11]|nr:hypothetical protein SAMN02910368_00201 [Lachnospiraceae bacterium G11]